MPNRRIAQPGDRHAAVRYQARADPPERIGDGQHGGGRHAAEVPWLDAAFTNSGGLRQDLTALPQRWGTTCEITWGEVFSVLPFGNRTVILTLTGAQLEQAFLNGFSPVCNAAIATGRFPQVSGLEATFACNGTTPVVTGMWKTPQGINGPADTDRTDRLSPVCDQRLHVHRRRRLYDLHSGDECAAAG